VLWKSAVLKFLLEVVAVDVVAVLATDEDHQVVVAVNEWVFLQDLSSSLFDTELVPAAMLANREGGSDGSDPERSREEQDYSK